MCSRPGVLLCAWLLLPGLGGCAGVPRDTPQTIAAREVVLLQTRARVGRMMRDRERVGWSGPGTVILTPTTLHVFHPLGSDALSYAIIDDVSRRTLRPVNPFGTSSAVDDLLVIQTGRAVCSHGCVFEFPGGAAPVMALIEQQRPLVDPFGRMNGPRPVWLSAGLRNARARWAQSPAYLLQTAAPTKSAVDDHFCTLLGCAGEASPAAVYGAAFRRLLGDASTAGYVFRTLDGLSVNEPTKLDTRSLMRVLAEADTTVDSLLVSDLVAIELRERVSSDYRISVEAIFRTFVDYHDLRPPGDGRYFIHGFPVTRPVDAWLATTADDLDAMIAEAAGATAERVRRELSASPSASGP